MPKLDWKSWSDMALELVASMTINEECHERVLTAHGLSTICRNSYKITFYNYMSVYVSAMKCNWIMIDKFRWIQEGFSAEPLRHDSGPIFREMVRVSPQKSEVTGQKSELQTTSQSCLPGRPQNPTRIGQKGKRMGVLGASTENPGKAFWSPKTKQFLSAILPSPSCKKMAVSASATEKIVQIYFICICNQMKIKK